jgi:hypothetical protein
MSWSTLNEILGLAVVDLTFQKELLEDPLKAVANRQYRLNKKEKKALSLIQANSIYEFTTRLLELLANDRSL